MFRIEVTSRRGEVPNIRRYSRPNWEGLPYRTRNAASPASSPTPRHEPPRLLEPEPLLVPERAQGGHVLEVEVERRRTHAHVLGERLDPERLGEVVPQPAWRRTGRWRGTWWLAPGPGSGSARRATGSGRRSRECGTGRGRPRSWRAGSHCAGAARPSSPGSAHPAPRRVRTSTVQVSDSAKWSTTQPRPRRAGRVREGKARGGTRAFHISERSWFAFTSDAFTSRVTPCPAPDRRPNTPARAGPVRGSGSGCRRCRSRRLDGRRQGSASGRRPGPGECLRRGQ